MEKDDSRRQKLEALGQLAAGVAHDVNNILSIIEGYVQIALKDMPQSEPLQKIFASTRRGAGLTRQLLAFSRQEIVPAEPVEIGAQLRELKMLVQPLLGEAIRLALSAPEEPVWILAAPDQFTQIILNLAINARDAMPQGGTLAIECKAGKTVRLQVADSGAGIASDILPHIFDPFFTTKDIGRVTGLGLAVVHGVVQQLKGSIEVRSAQGRGTRFDITLPRIAAPQAASTVDLKGRTILVAEDESELRDVLAVLFSGMEMKVLTASNGNHALRVQAEHKGDIDFLLTDVAMPEMDGVELGGKFAAARPASNVIYMSGYPFTGMPENADVIAKPFLNDSLRRILERALQRRDERLEKGETEEEP